MWNESGKEEKMQETARGKIESPERRAPKCSLTRKCIREPSTSSSGGGGGGGGYQGTWAKAAVAMATASPASLAPGA